MTTTTDAEDRAELRRLVNAYALAMDAGELNVFPKLFVADGALVVKAPGRKKPMGVFRGPGPEGIGLIALLMKEHYRATMHHITTHVAEIADDHAVGITHCLAYHMVAGEDGGLLETLGVRYEESFRRTSEGWRFEVREATRLWSQITPTPYEPLLVDRAAAGQIKA